MYLGELPKVGSTTLTFEHVSNGEKQPLMPKKLTL